MRCRSRGVSREGVPTAPADARAGCGVGTCGIRKRYTCISVRHKMRQTMRHKSARQCQKYVDMRAGA
jgi:hypothetical protein